MVAFFLKWPLLVSMQMTLVFVTNIPLLLWQSALEVSAQSGIANVTSWYGRIQSEMGNALPVLKLKTPEVHYMIQ